jgi:hypothetical protein
MKIDITVLANILEAFLEAEKPSITLDYILNKSGFKLSDDKFIFHYRLIIENLLVSDELFRTGNNESAGLLHDRSDTYSVIPGHKIRLTQKGHDLALSLNNREVLAKLKSELKDAPFKTIFDGSQKLLQHYFKKKIDALTE